VMKRLRDDQTKRDPTRKKKFDSTFSLPDDNSNNYFGSPRENSNPFQASASTTPVQPPPRRQAHTQAPAHPSTQAQPRQMQGQPLAHNQAVDMQIDPSLLLAAANDPSIMDRRMQNQFSDQQYDQQYTAQAAQAAFAPSPSSFAVYFRLHPASAIQASSRLWVSTLSSVSVDELRQLATVKFPGTIAVRIEGVIKQPNGHEMTLPIDQDEELEAYLAAINGVKPIFSVQLVSAWKT